MAAAGCGHLPEVQRHGLALEVAMLPFRDYDKEVAYMHRRPDLDGSSGSVASKHRMGQLVRMQEEQVGPPDRSYTSGLYAELSRETSGGQDIDPGPGNQDACVSATTAAESQEVEPPPVKRRPKRSNSWLTQKLGSMDASDLADLLEGESQRRCYDDLVSIEAPNMASAREAIKDLQGLLQVGLEQGRVPQQPQGRNQGPVEASMAALATAVERHATDLERETALVRLLNAIAAFHNQQLLPDLEGSSCKVGLPSHGSAVFAQQNSPLAWQEYRDQHPVIAEKPSVVGLVAAQDISANFRSSAVETCTWFEITDHVCDDLSRSLMRQILRYEYRRVMSGVAAGRSFGVTMSGRLLRLWMFDALGYTTSPAIDILDRADLKDLALLLTFLSGTVEALCQRWLPTLPRLNGLVFEMPDEKGEPTCWKVQVTKPLQDLSAAALSGLFGRRTVVYGGRADKLLKGHLRDGAFHVDSETAPQEDVDFVIKTGWLPSYLHRHEHRVLMRLQEHEVPDTPRSLGLLRPASPHDTWVTMQRSSDHPDAQAAHLETRALQLGFCVMLQRSALGTVMPTELKAFDANARVVALRAMTSLLFGVSRAGIHYRDINPGNILLKKNWRQLLEQGRTDIMILIDFGNSRLENERRGDADALEVKQLAPGLDDALSVNELFQSHISWESLSRWDDLGRLLRRGDDEEQDEDEGEDDGDRIVGNAARITDLRRRLAFYEHRYIDDLECIIYCLLHLAAKCEDVNRKWRMELDQQLQNPARKKWLWTEPSGFTTIQGQNKLMDRSITRLLERIRKTVYEAQLQHRADERSDLRTPKMSQVEVATFEKCLSLIDTWIKKKATSAQATAAGPGASEAPTTSLSEVPEAVARSDAVDRKIAIQGRPEPSAAAATWSVEGSGTQAAAANGGDTMASGSDNTQAAQSRKRRSYEVPPGFVARRSARLHRDG